MCVKHAVAAAPRASLFGVLVDDLITKGVNGLTVCLPAAPNTDCNCAKTTPICASPSLRLIGLISDSQWQAFEQKREGIEREIQRLKSTWYTPAKLPESEQ